MAEPVHLVLSAGGVRVISYVGAIDALEQGGFEFASVSACSAGTLIGALVAAGRSGSDLEQRVLGTDLRKLEGNRRLLGKVSALLGGWPYSSYVESGVPQFFRDILKEDPTFDDLNVPFSTAGVDMLSGRFLVYSSESHPEMKVAEAMPKRVARDPYPTVPGRPRSRESSRRARRNRSSRCTCSHLRADCICSRGLKIWRDEMRNGRVP